MSDLALITGGGVGGSVRQSKRRTAIAAVAILKGQATYLDATLGTLKLTITTGTTGARLFGIACNDAAIGQALECVYEGLVFSHDVSALAYDAPVYLSDTAGALATAAGSHTSLVGRVMPITDGLGSKGIYIHTPVAFVPS